MDWDLSFAATNLVALGGWLALALLPRREAVLGGVLWAGVALLCAAYTVMFVGLMGGLVDPVRDAAGPAPPFEYSVDGLKAMFASRGAIVVGWTHYLAFDLFVGLWIARDADTREVGRLVQIPFLFATFMAGPIGLLTWLLLRGALTKKPRR
jgi:hypothetical protein